MIFVPLLSPFPTCIPTQEAGNPAGASQTLPPRQEPKPQEKSE